MRSRFAGLLLIVIAVSASALDDSSTVRAVKVDSPPRIDGVLDEAVWQSIEPITDFRQREPADGEPISERTEVRICYDSRNLYIGVRAYDSDVGGLVRTIYERDGDINHDDNFFIYIVRC